ncbi:hypothetical protein AMJAP_3017 [Amphritea japonica ATCC BAA-1530]|uniref:Uncharacterized protein n=1 Tax=Amphritea japonica ATCC BAA-1530 TaxID=1278309 RepID=A0A7R6SUE9_9GAMM|nr:hypothetical protein AMJAP_3017 [Amphritea japonica ATCC BAA-1530]
MIGALVTAISGCQVKEESTQLTSTELQHLFSERTVESYNLVNGSSSFTYYKNDGKVLQKRYWEKRSGSWRITDNMICLQMEHKSESCRAVYLEGDRYYKYRTDDQGQPQKIIRYRQFLTGNRI